MSRTTANMAGFGLIEILVTMVIIAVGMLGIAALQARAQQAEIEAYQRSQAMILVEDMVNRIKANRSIAKCYEIDGFVGSGVSPAGCTSYAASERRDRVDADLNEWVRALDGLAEQAAGEGVGTIMGGRGCITLDGDVYTVTVAWQGVAETFAPDSNDCAAGEYGNEILRRVVSTSFRIADLAAN